MYELAHVDMLSTVMTGDFKSDLHVSNCTLKATDVLCVVIHCLSMILEKLQSSGITVRATGCLRSLIKAYTLTSLSPDSMHVILGQYPPTTPILKVT